MKNIIIVGGGIGGLTTAIALQHKGFSVRVYEQASELKEAGAGIWVAPNGLKVLEQLNIAKEIIQAGNTLDTINITDSSGVLISSIDNKKVQLKHGFSTVALHRGTLQKILASHIPAHYIFTNKKMMSFDDNGQTVKVHFTDGTSEEADALILADGIHSAGRTVISGNQSLRYSGQTCWRFVTKFDLPEKEKNNMYEIWGKSKGLRAAYSSIGNQLVYCYITDFRAAGGKDDPENLKHDLLQLCAEFPDIIHQLIVACPTEAIIRTDLFDFRPVSVWTKGNAALLGDAAHATTPNLGQGACQAMEDAYCIAEQLEKYTSVADAFRAYQQMRVAKATYITNASFQFARLTNTTGIMKSLVKTILRMTPERINEKQMDKIYTVNY